MCPFDPSPPNGRDPQVVDTGGVESEAGASSSRKNANLHREQRRLDDLVFQSSIRLAQSARKAQKVGGTRTAQKLEKTTKRGAHNFYSRSFWRRPLGGITPQRTANSTYFVCAEHRVMQYIRVVQMSSPFRCWKAPFLSRSIALKQRPYTLFLIAATPDRNCPMLGRPKESSTISGLAFFTWHTW